MPFSKANAPPGTPTIETIESLLGRSNKKNSRTRRIKTFHQLTDEEKQRTGLVKLGQRCIDIPGDPFAIMHSWSGNIGHPGDEQMMAVLPPIFKDLGQNGVIQSEAMQAMQDLLQKLPTTPALELAQEIGEDQMCKVICDDAEETVIDFRLKSRAVRLMVAKDIDKDAPDPYGRTKRAQRYIERADQAFNERPMTISEQQFLMAKVLQERDGQLVAETTPSEGFFSTLRSLAQERFWLLESHDQRINYREQALQPPPEGLESMLTLVRMNWQPRWDNSRNDPDFFYHYARDQAASQSVWGLVTADLFIVTDRSQRVIFAHFEELGQLLYGQETVDRMQRALDLWSYYTPLPAPETRRHVVDRYIRRIHPELDPETATVDKLPQAKMAVAHLGCWAPQGHSSGRYIVRTSDALFGKARMSLTWPRLLFDDFCTSVLGKVTNLIRFLMEGLDPDKYAECVDILENLPPGEKLKTDDVDFLSLFALGVNAYTQRHKDTGDMRGGLAGLVTLGSYTGGNLCVPALGIKVRYGSGSCALIRGDKLEHLVSDYSGPRYFIVGTNHESARRYVDRQNVLKKRGSVLGDLESSFDAHESESENESDDDAEFPLQLPCINQGTDEDDEGIIYQNNKSLHGARALDSGSSHCS